MIISVFYDIDNFCKELKKYFEHYLIATDGEASSFEPPCGISLSEIMTVCVFSTYQATGLSNGTIQSLSKRNTASSSQNLSATTGSWSLCPMPPCPLRCLCSLWVPVPDFCVIVLIELTLNYK